MSDFSDDEQVEPTFVCDYAMCETYFVDRCNEDCCNGQKDCCEEDLKVFHGIEGDVSFESQGAPTVEPADSASNVDALGIANRKLSLTAKRNPCRHLSALECLHIETFLSS